MVNPHAHKATGWRIMVRQWYAVWMWVGEICNSLFSGPHDPRGGGGGFPRSQAWQHGRANPAVWPLTSDTWFMSLLRAATWTSRDKDIMLFEMWCGNYVTINSIVSFKCLLSALTQLSRVVFVNTLSGELITGVRLLGRKLAANSVPHLYSRRMKRESGKYDYDWFLPNCW